MVIVQFWNIIKFQYRYLFSDLLELCMNSINEAPKEEMNDWLANLIFSQYHYFKQRKLWMDCAARCHRILSELLVHWSKYNGPVPWTMLKHVSLHSKEYKKLKENKVSSEAARIRRKTFSNNLKLLQTLGLVEKINGHGYSPSTLLQTKWRDEQRTWNWTRLEG